MQIGSVFENNRTQAVRLPAETRFPGDVKKVSVRVVGDVRVLSPLNKTWDDFFLQGKADSQGQEGVTEDFMNERASQNQPERESF